LPPPVLARQDRQESLPLVEIMLPELADKTAEDAPGTAPSLLLEPPPPEDAEALDLLLWSAPESEPAREAPEPPAPAPAPNEAAPLPELPPWPPIEPRFVAIEEPPSWHEDEPAVEMAAEPEPPPTPRVEPETVASTPPAPAEEPVPAAPDAADILDYWDSLRGGRDFPSLDELDRAHVGATWPNTVLLAVEGTDLPRITRLGESDGEVEYTATVIDWIMSRGRNAAKRGEPMEEERRFSVSAGGARYRMLLLPLSSYGLTCDHVLCQLSRVPELGAVASFKRWLAS
jgi:hypothetical protein